jgi:hypothetical protein
MSVEIWQTDRPKGRSPRWNFRVECGGINVFDSAWVAVRYRAREDAAWLAALVERLVTSAAFAGCPGHPGQVAALLNWDSLPRDDLAAELEGIYGHAEHMSGPARGGIWYCQVSAGPIRYFHTADIGVEPRSREAAWWLCEVVMCAVLADVWGPMP